jgi:hypothetical protein
VALFALGLSGGDDPSSDEVAVSPTPTATATAKKDGKPKRRTPAAPRFVNLKIVPEAEVNVCLVDATGEPLIRSETIAEPTEAYKAKRMRVTFGNGLATMVINGKEFDVPDTDAAIGFELKPGADPKPLPDDQLPTCA